MLLERKIAESALEYSPRVDHHDILNLQTGVLPLSLVFWKLYTAYEFLFRGSAFKVDN